MQQPLSNVLHIAIPDNLLQDAYIDFQRSIDRFEIAHKSMLKFGLRGRTSLRGYCTPGQFLDCFCIFLKNYNTLITSKICLL